MEYSVNRLKLRNPELNAATIVIRLLTTVLEAQERPAPIEQARERGKGSSRSRSQQQYPET
jgi:hypothetical protein